MNEVRDLIEALRDTLQKKAETMCQNYCKYKDQCYQEQTDDDKEDAIFDKCPLNELFYH